MIRTKLGSVGYDNNSSGDGSSTFMSTLTSTSEGTPPGGEVAPRVSRPSPAVCASDGRQCFSPRKSGGPHPPRGCGAVPASPHQEPEGGSAGAGRQANGRVRFAGRAIGTPPLQVVDVEHPDGSNRGVGGVNDGNH